MKPIGILGLGIHLPPAIRTNEYWSAATVRSWTDKAARRAEKLRDALIAQNTEGARLTLAAIDALAHDPFQGARQRHVIADDATSADLETIAAREAIQRAGIDPAEIDLVLSHQVTPDYIYVASSNVVHHNLGLSRRCTSVGVEAGCNSFTKALTLAQGMIASGQSRYALIVNGAAMTRHGDSGEMIDAWGGDGASAAVVGPVREGYGLLAYAHHTEGQHWGALTFGVPGGRWQDGRCEFYPPDRAANLNMVTAIADRAKLIVGEAIAEAGMKTSDIAFFAGHQGFRWLLEVTQKITGLSHARSIEHFHYTGTMSAVNVPYQLAVAEREGMLRSGDLVACFTGGTGMTNSGMVMRWGS